MRNASSGGIGPRAFRKILPLHQFHHEDPRPVGLLESVDRGDVGVVERSEHLGFPLEAPHALLVLGKDRGQDLERYLAVQPGIGGPIHLTHSSGTELVGDLVMSDRLSNHGECLQNIIKSIWK
jgi:hypothetical protein